ncbi:Zinc finger CCCH domain-containing protein 41 [Linum perenne]
MERRVSALKRVGLSASDCVSDPEEKEVSDDDDDDRNHKHRRKETRSEYMERDSPDPVSTSPYRKKIRHFENGHSFRQNESEDYTAKFEKRYPGPGHFSQRVRMNQPFSGNSGSFRGRGRDPGPWSQRDSRFNQPNLAAGIFAGRGLPNVSNPQGASWNAFGMNPGIPNGGLDTLHTMGLQGSLVPAVNASLNMGIRRQRCRDFEERGFCLRGDMCPMEHGVNRIVVEDVQSLSQFNLPVSLPNAQLVGTPAVPGGLQPMGAPSSMSMSKAVNGKSSKSGLYDENIGMNGGFPSSSTANEADFYDPDQPLWNNNDPETSNTLLPLHSSRNNESESVMNIDHSDRNRVRLHDSTDNAGMHTGSVTDSSIWGRVGSMRNRSDGKERVDSTADIGGHLEDEAKENQETSANLRGAFRQGKNVTTEDIGPSSAKAQGEPMRVMRKPSQKALRTLFVNGIPHMNRKKEALLSHFQKFGEVIDIFIPSNSERAFVQFSKTEAAEAALRAPDAVMGNRFIKLFWANRDSVLDDGVSSSSGVSIPPRGMTSNSLQSHPPVANMGKDSNQYNGTKVPGGASRTDSSMSSNEYQKFPNTNSPKCPPPLQKKLEHLKEELRKKQEMLDQKKNDFRRQLEKLQKQATVTKNEVVSETTNKPKVAGDAANCAGPTLSDPPSPCGEMRVYKNKSTETLSSTSKLSAETAPLQSSGSKPSEETIVPFVGSPYLPNRFKLDNRPTTFRIVPPLPAGLANVAALKEHFSTFGDLTSVEVEDAEPCNSDGNASETGKLCSANVTFATRRSAEKAFLYGKNWQENSLQFVWVASSTSIGEPGSKTITLVVPAEKVKTVDSGDNASASGNGEAQNSEMNDVVEEKRELLEASQAYSNGESLQVKPAGTEISCKEEAVGRESGEGNNGC